MDTSKLKKIAQFTRCSLGEQVATKFALVLSPGSTAWSESPQTVKKLEEAIQKSGGEELVIERVAYYIAPEKQEFIEFPPRNKRSLKATQSRGAA